MRRHTVLKLAGRLDHPGERYPADWRTWMYRASKVKTYDVVNVTVTVDGVLLTEEATATFSDS